MNRKNLFHLIGLCCLLTSFSCKRSSPLFKQISASKSGIDFINQVSESDSFNILSYLYYYNGGGVAIGDFNVDGLPDVFLSGNEVSSALYLNSGNLKFKEVSKIANISTSHWITGATVVDINSDHLPDIYLSVSAHSDPAERKNLLYVNQGIKNGMPSFLENAEAYGIADTGFCTQSVFFDADLDGDLDLYILNHGNDKEKVNTPLLEVQNDPSSDRFYRNNGNGTFSDISEYSGISDMAYGLGIAISDVNEDGLPDIFVANDFIANDKLYINQGNAIFKNEINDYLPYQSYNSMGCDIADMDNDGFPEIWVLDMLPSNLNKFRQMAGSMTPFKWEYMQKMGYEPQYMRNTFFKHKGFQANKYGFVFQEEARKMQVASTDWSWAVLMADYDGDGLKDALVTNGYLRDITDIDFIQFSASLNQFNGAESSRISLMGEIRKRPSLAADNQLFIQNDEGKFKRSSMLTSTQLDCSQGVAYADFDLDGDLDLVINKLNSPATLVENSSNLKDNYNFLQLKLNGPKGNVSGIGAKITCYIGKEKQVIWQYPVRGFLSQVSEVLNFGLGTSNHVDSLFIKWPDGTYWKKYNVKSNQLLKVNYFQNNLAFAKNKEIKSWIVNENAVENNLITLPSNELSSVEKDVFPLIVSRSTLKRNRVAVADVNQDGFTDFYYNGKIYLIDNKGLKDSITLDKEDNLTVTESIFVDFNGDEKIDLLQIHGQEIGEVTNNFESFTLFSQLKNGKWIKNKEVNFPKGENFYTASLLKIKAASFLLLCGGRVSLDQYPTGGASGLYLIENGRFIKLEVPLLSSLLPIKDVTWADLDGNGFQDIILVGEWMSPVIFFQSVDFKFSKHTLEDAENGLNGWWRSILATDIDNDGDKDLFFGNEGLNNRFHVSKQHPLYLFSADWDNNQKMEPLHAMFTDKNIYPIHFLNEVIRQIPLFRFKYSKHQLFTSSTLEDVVTKKLLRNAAKYQVNQFSSIWMENKGNKNFDVHYLPDELQSAPINGFLDISSIGNETKILCYGNDEKVDVHTGFQLGFDPVFLGMNKNSTISAIRQKRLFSRGIMNQIIPLWNKNTGHLLISEEVDGVLKINSIKNDFSHINIIQHD